MKKELSLENVKNKNPDLTKAFINFMKAKAMFGIYRVEIAVGNKNIPIDVFPTVFPPKSNYSASSKSVFETFSNLRGLEIADVGSGSGIESVVAAMNGAKHVDAGDINPQAVACSKHNVKLNNLQNNVTVFCSDLFQNFPKKKYDLIIANLPIVNFGTSNNPINNTLYDKGLEIHKRLLIEAKEFLAEGGIITFTHANLQSAKTASPDYDFMVLEKLINDYGYKVTEKIEREDFGYEWINYKIKLNGNSYQKDIN